MVDVFYFPHCLLLSLFRKDTFSLRCPDLGRLSRVFIRHDNTGVCPSWYLEGVDVTEDGETTTTTRFPCGQWLEECEGCGGDLGVGLLPEGSDEISRKTQKGSNVAPNLV